MDAFVLRHGGVGEDAARQSERLHPDSVQPIQNAKGKVF